jgi:hypothetical protein
VGRRQRVPLGQGGAGRRRIGGEQSASGSDRTDQQVCSCSLRFRRRDAGTSEAGSSAVEAFRGAPRVLDWPAGLYLTA